jgi:hypothetical protein
VDAAPLGARNHPCMLERAPCSPLAFGLASEPTNLVEPGWNTENSAVHLHANDAVAVSRAPESMTCARQQSRAHVVHPQTTGTNEFTVIFEQINMHEGNDHAPRLQEETLQAGLSIMPPGTQPELLRDNATARTSRVTILVE